MHAFFDPANQYLTIDVGPLEHGVDTVDIAHHASVVVDEAGAPVSIELPGPVGTADDALRAVARCWEKLDHDALLAAAHAAYAAPRRDVTVGVSPAG